MTSRPGRQRGSCATTTAAATPLPTKRALSVPVELGFSASRRWALRPSIARAPGSSSRTCWPRSGPTAWCPHIVFRKEDSGLLPGALGLAHPVRSADLRDLAAAGRDHGATPPVRAVRRRRACPHTRAVPQAVRPGIAGSTTRAIRTAWGHRHDPSLGDRPRQCAGLGRRHGRGRYRRRRALHPPRHQPRRPVDAPDQAGLRPLPGDPELRRRRCDWDPLRIYRDGPFLVADPGLTFILLRADRDLLWLAEQLGERAAAGEIARMDRAWRDRRGAVVAAGAAVAMPRSIFAPESRPPRCARWPSSRFYAGLTEHGGRACPQPRAVSRTHRFRGCKLRPRRSAL